MNPDSRLRSRLFLTVASLSALAGASAARAEAPAARDIMDKVAETRRLAGSEAVVTMKIVNERGKERERTLAMATKLSDDGKTEKRVYRFLSPADVEGTGVLVFDHDDAADDMWVYLPALRKTRRIVSSQRSKSFMGSEFSYADLNVPPLDDYSYELTGQEDVEGESCWVIAVQPKNQETAKGEGYSKKKYWISQDAFVVRRALFYDLKGKLLKELTTHKTTLLDPEKKRYRTLRMVMVNKQNGRRSVFDTKKVAFTPKTADDHFTKRALERP